MKWLRFKLSLRKQLPGILGIALLINAAWPVKVQASNFFEAVGIGVVAGTVVGLSSLPFYQTPGDHLGNLGIGAAAGLAAGLGVWVYGLVSPSTEGSEHSLIQRNDGPDRLGTTSTSLWSSSSTPATDLRIWMPLASLRW